MLLNVKLQIFKCVLQVGKKSHETDILGIVLGCESSKYKENLSKFCSAFFRYSVDRHTDMDRIFNIDSGNGSIFTSKLLDRETLLWHNITVIATEISKSSLSWLLSPIDGESVISARAGTGSWNSSPHHHVLIILLDT